MYGGGVQAVIVGACGCVWKAPEFIPQDYITPFHLPKEPNTCSNKPHGIGRSEAELPYETGMIGATHWYVFMANCPNPIAHGINDCECPAVSTPLTALEPNM